MIIILTTLEDHHHQSKEAPSGERGRSNESEDEGWIRMMVEKPVEKDGKQRWSCGLVELLLYSRGGQCGAGSTNTSEPVDPWPEASPGLDTTTSVFGSDV